MLKIVTAPSNVLSEQAKTVVKVDKEILKLIEEMKQTLRITHDPEGVGLAAPQVGKSLQLFITRPTLKSPFSVFINPVIKSKSQELAPLKRPKRSKAPSKLEGCLSLPNIWGTVLRPPYVEVEYMDEKGNCHTRKISGFLATVIQHEYDHLQGILFPKRVLEQKGKLYKSHKDEKKEDVFEEIEL